MALESTLFTAKPPARRASTFVALARTTSVCAAFDRKPCFDRWNGYFFHSLGQRPGSPSMPNERHNVRGILGSHVPGEVVTVPSARSSSVRCSKSFLPLMLAGDPWRRA